MFGLHPGSRSNSTAQHKRGFVLDGGVEKLMWERALQVYGDSLSTILRQALAVYKRTAGMDDLTRLYPSTTGSHALLMVRQELIMRWPNGSFGDSDLCVELRSRPRSHLNQHVLRRVADDRADSPALRDALFGLDLGL